MNSHDFQCFDYGGNQRMPTGISFENCVQISNAKLDHLMLHAKLDDLMHLIEQKRNVNAFNSNHLT